MSVLPVLARLCTKYVPSVCECRKRASDSLDLQMAVNYLPCGFQQVLWSTELSSAPVKCSAVINFQS